MLQLAFYAFSALTLTGALAILLTRNVLYAAFFLLLTLLGVAGLFVLASADFLAVAQLMVYVGGVLVLIIFGIMLTHKPNVPVSSQQPNRIILRSKTGTGRFFSLLIASGLCYALCLLIVRANFSLLDQPVGWQNTVSIIGIQLMTEYVVPFEIIGILLLAALVGATYLAASQRKPFRNATR